MNKIFLETFNYLNESFYKISKSSISGKGTFASKDIKKGTNIGLALTKKSNTGNDDKDWERTDLCKYTNHSNNSNLTLVNKNNKYYFISKINISNNIELTINYNEFPFEGKRDFAKQ